MNLRETLATEIREQGSLPFEVFQARSLYDPEDGFFASDTLRSTASGDFLTSPEVSSLFGETLARYVDAEWERLGRPQSMDLVEVAAGSGSLLRPLMASAEAPLTATAVEVSPAARSALSMDFYDVRSELPDAINGVLIANELIDNLPVALAIWEGDHWTERWVGLDGEELVLVPVAARPEVAAWAGEFGVPVEAGGIVEVQLAATAWLQEAAHRLKSGSIVLIDYGDTAENLAPRRADGTLRTYRSHHLGPHPLAEPGETDITVDVNFTALTVAAEALGLETHLSRQDDFLAEWGLREQLSELRRKELSHAAGGDSMERLVVRSRKTEAETLMHQRGLGDFRVLTLHI